MLLMHPIDKFDPKFIRRVAAPHELGFIELHVVHEINQRGDCRLPNPDGADSRRFYQRYRTSRATPEVGRRHPAGRTTTDNHDTTDIVHDLRTAPHGKEGATAA